MIERWMKRPLAELMGARRGVNLTGVRQSGKTTLAGAMEFAAVRRYTLDDRIVRQAAERDPSGFVKRTAGETLVIDEVQKVPDLLDAVKIAVDGDASKGQFLLTGSSNIRFAKAVRDSLAGRLGRVRLRTLSLGEINGRPPSFLDCAFGRDFRSEYPAMDKRDVIHAGFAGGYPEPLEFPIRLRRDWFRTYLDDILQKDVQDVTEIRKLEVLRQIAAWLLARTAQFFAVEELAAKTGVAKVTAESYLDVLRALYLFDKVPAWAKSDYELVGKRPKWIATDAGLVANVLGWNEEDVYLDATRDGKLVETWVYQQLAALADADGGCAISHYRDGKKREIDFLVEKDDGALLGIEVKAGAVSRGDFGHLSWFARHLAPASFTGIVLYSGKDTLSFGDGLYAVPLSALGA